MNLKEASFIGALGVAGLMTQAGNDTESEADIRIGQLPPATRTLENDFSGRAHLLVEEFRQEQQQEFRTLLEMHRDITQSVNSIKNHSGHIEEVKEKAEEVKNTALTLKDRLTELEEAQGRIATSLTSLGTDIDRLHSSIELLEAAAERNEVNLDSINEALSAVVVELYGKYLTVAEQGLRMELSKLEYVHAADTEFFVNQMYAVELLETAHLQNVTEAEQREFKKGMKELSDTVCSIHPDHPHAEDIATLGQITKESLRHKGHTIGPATPDEHLNASHYDPLCLEGSSDRKLKGVIKKFLKKISKSPHGLPKGSEKILTKLLPMLRKGNIAIELISDLATRPLNPSNLGGHIDPEVYQKFRERVKFCHAWNERVHRAIERRRERNSSGNNSSTDRNDPDRHDRGGVSVQRGESSSDGDTGVSPERIDKETSRDPAPSGDRGGNRGGDRSGAPEGKRPERDKQSDKNDGRNEKKDSPNDSSRPGSGGSDLCC
jgi:hypothetical protein